MIFSIFREYGLDTNLEKVRAIVTDNASNFVKAFKQNAKLTIEPQIEEGDSDTDIDFQEGEPDNIETTDLHEIFDTYGRVGLVSPSVNISESATTTFSLVCEDSGSVNHALASDNKPGTETMSDNSDHVHKFPGEGSEYELEMYLPQHFRCCSHTLNLLATTDAKHALEKDLNFRRALLNVRAKCQSVWNSLSHSSKNNDLVMDVFEKKLIRPNATRWNSEYDALKRILECQQAGKLTTVCDVLKKPRFKQNEIDFLIEYVSVLEPIAIALDMLQVEDKAFFGIIFPTVRSLERKLQKLQLSVKYTKALVGTLLEGLKQRFPFLCGPPSLYADYHLATSSHPYFKDKFVRDEDKETVVRMLVNEAKALGSKQSTSKDIVGFELLRSPQNFFEMSDEEEATIQSDEMKTTRVEVLRYLSDSRQDVSVLRHYPMVELVFRKFNCIPPTSAPVERLFSKGGVILCPRRSSLADHRFESLVLLKANRSLKI